jgi:predicted nucleic acid-binding protein
VIVDASVWVSGLLADDVHHSRSRHWLQQQTEQGLPLVIPTLALAEVSGAISRRTGGPLRIRDFLRRWVSTPGLQLIPVDEELGMEAARLAARYRLRGADAIYVALAHVLATPLVTLDHEMRTRGGRVVSVSEPN